MQNVSRSSIYEQITLEKQGATPVRLESRVLNFSYFESLFSPHITANFTYIDVGNGMTANGKDTQERYGTILSSLPLEGNGKTNVRFKITNEWSSLDFTSYPLTVEEPIPLGRQANREVVYVKLVSPAAIKNSNTRVGEKYYNNITNSISSILKNKLNIPENKIILEPTKNSYAFPGSSKRPFDLILSCAAKSMPVNGSAGFMFWETQAGFNFKSVDSIASTTPVATYRYYGVARTSIEETQDNLRILSQPTYRHNTNLMKLLNGVLKVKVISWNPYATEYQETFISLDKANLKILGNSTAEFNSNFTDNNNFNFNRTYFLPLDTGNSEIGISTAINNNPVEYQPKAIMRYNLFVAQMVDIMVPANFNLKAGDVIQCQFEKVTTSNKNEGVFDEYQSGNYVILNLCHYVNPTRSFTSLRLVRDAYGLYTSGGL